MRTLIVYASEDGQTEKIAFHITDRLRECRCPSDVYNLSRSQNDPVALDAYDAAIVGSPMHFSHYDRSLAAYLREYRETLREIPSAFFSVSLAILSDEESEQAAVHKLTEEYLVSTGWNPQIRTHFGGALRYSKYGWFKRHLMKRVSAKEGGPTDTRIDYEFTDWDRVDQFVDQFIGFVISCKTPGKASDRHSIATGPVRRYSIRNREQLLVSRQRCKPAER